MGSRMAAAYARGSRGQHPYLLALLEMARATGAWPPEDPLEGLETDIRLAWAINYGRLHEPGKASHEGTENPEE